MNLQVSCESCDGTFSVPEKFVGKRVKCPSCGEPVLVRDDDHFDDEPPVRSRKPAAGKMPAKPSKNSKKQKGKSGSISPLMIGGGVFAGIFGIGLTAILLMARGKDPQPVADTVPVVAPVQGANTQVAQQPASTPVATSSPQPAPVQAAPATPQPVAQPVTGPAVPANPQPAPAQPAPAQPGPATPATPMPTPATPMPTPAKSKPEPALRDVAKYKATEADRKKKLSNSELIKKVEPAVTKVHVATPRGRGHGSGSLIDASGIVVTNAHVMENGMESHVEFADGRTAKVIGFYSIDFYRDICIIQIDLPIEKVISTIKYRPEMVEKAEQVLAFGSPLGLDFTVSQGQVSGLRTADDMKTMVGRPAIKGDWVQTTTAISGGNSGGPLVDHYGNIVGMNTLGSSGIAQNLNFAISSVDILDSLSRRPDKHEPVNAARLKRPDEAKRADWRSPRRSEIGIVGIRPMEIYETRVWLHEGQSNFLTLTDGIQALQPKWFQPKW